MKSYKHKVLWEDGSLRFDRIQFVAVNHKVYDCVDRHVREKKRNQTVSLFFISIFQFSLLPAPDMFVFFPVGW